MVDNDLEADGGLSWDAVSTSISGDSEMPSAPPSSDLDSDMLADAHRPSKVKALRYKHVSLLLVTSVVRRQKTTEIEAALAVTCTTPCRWSVRPCE